MLDKRPYRNGHGTESSHIHLSYTRTKPVAGRVAILGTGKMGSAIAARLADAGFELVLWNRTRSRADALGLDAVADTPASAASGADIIISSLTGPDAVLATYLGPDGALAAGAGKHFVDMSTAGPDLVADLAPHVAAAGGTLSRCADPGSSTGRPRRRGRPSWSVAPARTWPTSGPCCSTFGTVRLSGRRAAPHGSSSWPTACSPTSSWRRRSSRWRARTQASIPTDVFFVLKRVAPSLAARQAGLEGHHTPTLFALRDLRKDVDLAMTL